MTSAPRREARLRIGHCGGCAASSGPTRARCFSCHLRPRWLSPPARSFRSSRGGRERADPSGDRSAIVRCPAASVSAPRGRLIVGRRRVQSVAIQKIEREIRDRLYARRSGCRWSFTIVANGPSSCHAPRTDSAPSGGSSLRSHLLRCRRPPVPRSDGAPDRHVRASRGHCGAHHPACDLARQRFGAEYARISRACRTNRATWQLSQRKQPRACES